WDFGENLTTVAMAGHRAEHRFDAPRAPPGLLEHRGQFPREVVPGLESRERGANPRRPSTIDAQVPNALLLTVPPAQLVMAAKAPSAPVAILDADDTLAGQRLAIGRTQAEPGQQVGVCRHSLDDGLDYAHWFHLRSLTTISLMRRPIRR